MKNATATSTPTSTPKPTAEALEHPQHAKQPTNENEAGKSGLYAAREKETERDIEHSTKAVKLEVEVETLERRLELHRELDGHFQLMAKCSRRSLRSQERRIRRMKLEIAKYAARS